jgi:plasmid stabilization system protein ParE
MFGFWRSSHSLAQHIQKEHGGPLREIVFRSYRIFYDVSEESIRVDILHVWHAARGEPEL